MRLLVVLLLLNGIFIAYLHADTKTKETPKRVISLLPSLSETVCSLGACHRLVGVDNYSNYPSELTDLPRLGQLGRYSIEGIVRLEPDLVLVPRSARLGKKLQSLGINVLILEPQTTQEAREAFLQIGSILGIEDAVMRWDVIENQTKYLTEALPFAANKQTVYFVISLAGYAAGANSYIGELLKRTGLKNIVSEELSLFPKLNPEFVTRASPDIVMTLDTNKQFISERYPAQRYCYFNQQQSDALSRPGPRMPEAVTAIVDCLRADDR